MSAQQARERKKVYVTDLESRAKDLQDRNSKLEEKISTLVNENIMLRKVNISYLSESFIYTHTHTLVSNLCHVYIYNLNPFFNRFL